MPWRRSLGAYGSLAPRDCLTFGQGWRSRRLRLLRQWPEGWPMATSPSDCCFATLRWLGRQDSPASTLVRAPSLRLVRIDVRPVHRWLPDNQRMVTSSPPRLVNRHRAGVVMDLRSHQLSFWPTIYFSSSGPPIINHLDQLFPIY